MYHNYMDDNRQKTMDGKRGVNHKASLSFISKDTPAKSNTIER